MFAGPTARSRIELRADRDQRGAAAAVCDRDIGGERRSRDAKTADIHQILAARPGRRSKSVMVSWPKPARNLKMSLPAPPPSESLPAPPFSVSLPAPPTRRLANVVAGQRQTGRPCVRPQELDLRTRRERVVDAGDDRVGALAHGLVHHVAGIVDEVGVVAGAAGHGVGTGAAVQRVVAGAADQRVVAGVADQGVGELVAGERQAGRSRSPVRLSTSEPAARV